MTLKEDTSVGQSVFASYLFFIISSRQFSAGKMQLTKVSWLLNVAVTDVTCHVRAEETASWQFVFVQSLDRADVPVAGT